jgi:hypothetical protein
MSSKLETITTWLTLLSNIGVVAGFVLIAFQLQQNTKALQVQGAALSSNANIAAESALMGENVASAFAQAYREPRNLTDEQLMQVQGYLTTSFNAIQQTYFNYNSGIASEEEWLTSKRYAVEQLRWSVGRAYWNATRDFYDHKFASEIDIAIKGTKATAANNYLTDLRDALDKELVGGGT